MTFSTHPSSLEIVATETGRYSVREIGSTTLNEDAPVFDSLIEAENWLFDEIQQLDDDSSALHTIKPGGGQAVR
jgi:hypothetical protein